MRRSVLALLLAGGAVAGAATIGTTAGSWLGAPKAAAVPKEPRKPREVGVVELKAETLAVTVELAGRTAPRLVAEIRPQVSGLVLRRPFQEGASVKAGDLLYQLDPSPFEAAVASARAQVRRTASQAQAARVLAARNAELFELKATSQQTHEAAQAGLEQAEAEHGAAQAALEAARIQLAHTRILAPIAGTVGLSAVTQGALVTNGQASALTTVQQIDPIHVDMVQSSADLLRLRREFGKDARKSGSVPIQVRLEDGSVYPLEGRLTYSGLNVNPGTGAVVLRAVVPNPDQVLLPGMYVRATVTAGTQERALLVPQQSVSRDARGDAWVTVVGADHKLAKRAVVVDREFHNRWRVVSGLAEGELVVFDGAERVKPGDTVRPLVIAPVGPDAQLASASAR